jgi:hypothetical protein
VAAIQAYHDNSKDSVNQVHSFSETLKDYHNEQIQFCFNAGSSELVIAYAAVWDTGGPSDTLNITSV